MWKNEKFTVTCKNFPSKHIQKNDDFLLTLKGYSDEMDEIWNFSLSIKCSSVIIEKYEKRDFFQNSDAFLVKFRCENSCFSSPHDLLHLPAFAGFSTDSKTLNPLDFKNICHSWANLGEIDENSNLEKCVL